MPTVSIDHGEAIVFAHQGQNPTIVTTPGFIVVEIEWQCTCSLHLPRPAAVIVPALAKLRWRWQIGTAATPILKIDHHSALFRKVHWEAAVARVRWEAAVRAKRAEGGRQPTVGIDYAEAIAFARQRQNPTFVRPPIECSHLLESGAGQVTHLAGLAHTAQV
eukprot:CAMPEP_0180113922 /NCGR_PEP_ID=MMETSP0985-20121206/37027_1 /TAXON_ID=483367 /ORGANISM="non described non described, Strain CCMP 2436" /LENGTH=161 /DNA_ID=CAMNT_0022052431 /DNA_START=49 /DNA_END=534 /DNA_ORIENTATION=-